MNLKRLSDILGKYIYDIFGAVMEGQLTALCIISIEELMGVHAMDSIIENLLMTD